MGTPPSKNQNSFISSDTSSLQHTARTAARSAPHILFVIAIVLDAIATIFFIAFSAWFFLISDTSVPDAGLAYLAMAAAYGLFCVIAIPVTLVLYFIQHNQKRNAEYSPTAPQAD